MAYCVFTASHRPRALILMGLVLCVASHVQGAHGGIVAAAAIPAQKSTPMTLRGGADATAVDVTQDDEAAAAQKAMQEQLDYWNSLSKEQQEALLANMSPEERANAEGLLFPSVLALHPQLLPRPRTYGASDVAVVVYVPVSTQHLYPASP
jgi:hypothetical protein